MSNAGDYWISFRHLVQSTTQDAIGDPVESWTQQGKLWGDLEISGSNLTSQFNALQSGISGKIRLRNYPTIKARDRLVDYYDQTWRVESTYFADNETVCEVILYDSD